jgi:uncharacterized protein involved in tolerance to divalent cations
MFKIYQITTTFDSDDYCLEFSNKLIELKLVGCCQISSIVSFYEWKGSIAKEEEYKLVCKTLKKMNW